MNSRPLSELSLYRYRYGIAYLCLIVVTLGLLLLNIQTLPNGLSQAEQTSALASSAIPFTKDFLQTVDTIDLPYHLLQRGSLELFGLSPLGVRLPSIILATLSTLFVFLTLRRWLFSNVALITGLLMATSSWMLMLGRSGSPEIMIVFWTSSILLLATFISQQTQHHLAWKALAMLCAGLALYTPLMGYLFLSGFIASLAQPHLRYIVRYADGTVIALGTLLLSAALVPLAWHVWREPHILYTILGIADDLPSPLVFATDFINVIGNLINPFYSQLAPRLLPLLSIPVAALVLLGFARLVVDYHSARSYTLLVWFAVLVPIIGLNPQQTAILLVPLLVVCGIGMHALFSYWYRLFPRNPYARVFGLLPIGLLLITTIGFNYQRYFLAQPYAAEASQLYNADPFLLYPIITAKNYKDEPVTIVAPAGLTALYKINQNVVPNLVVLDAPTFTNIPPAAHVIVAASEFGQLTPAQQALLPQAKRTLVTSDRANDALRFIVYDQVAP